MKETKTNRQGNTMWYYTNANGKEVGPVEEFAIHNAIRAGVITSETPVRKKNWTTSKRATVAFKDSFVLVARDLIQQGQGTGAPTFEISLVEQIQKDPEEDFKRFILKVVIGVVVFFLFLLFSASHRGIGFVGLVVLLLFSFVCGGIALWAILTNKMNADRSLLEEREGGIKKNRESLNLYRKRLDEYKQSVLKYREDLLERSKRLERNASAVVQDKAKTVALAYMDSVYRLNRVTLSTTNFPSCHTRLISAIRSCRAIGFDVSPEEEGKKVADLKADYETLLRVAAEREAQRAIREKMREEARILQKAKEEKEQAERERALIEAALKEAMEKAQGEHNAEIESLQKQLDEAVAKSERAVSMAQLTKAGHVYILSNIGSFGKDVYKIGMTRRLDPEERVSELGSASVPFPFDIHAMITCEDAPALEHTLHRALHRFRVNKVNFRKEYFHVPLEEIIKVVEQNFGKVEYVADPEALQYIQSQDVTLDDLDYLEEVFDKIGDESEE